MLLFNLKHFSSISIKFHTVQTENVTYTLVIQSVQLKEQDPSKNTLSIQARVLVG